MNPVIDTLLQHRTYRAFDPGHTIAKAEVDAMLAAARQAPSWMNGQHYTIIRITDAALRRKITAAQPGNPQIGSCAEYWLFIGDAHKAELCSRAYGGSMTGVGVPDTLITLTTDAALAAQNAVIAAESLGYAVCYTGGIRQIAAELTEWLALPAHTFPSFGLCIGKPAVAMRRKPRLPLAAVVAENRYPDDATLSAALADYETTMTAFGEVREKLPYREKFARYYSREYGAGNPALLKRQGLLTHPDGLDAPAPPDGAK